MEPKELLDILQRAGKLKENVRHNWIREDRKESVADHSYRIALMAMLLGGEEEFRSLDMNKVIRMCLIHDLGEAFTGDIPAFEKNGEDEAKEEEIFLNWVKTFPSPQKEEWLALLEEMAQQETYEAKVYKSLDKLEAVISHDEADIRTWLSIEYDLQLSYCVKQTAFSPYLTELRENIDEWTRQKIANASKTE